MGHVDLFILKYRSRISNENCVRMDGPPAQTGTADFKGAGPRYDVLVSYLILIVEMLIV